jgi:hypothetical protein
VACIRLTSTDSSCAHRKHVESGKQQKSALCCKIKNKIKKVKLRSIAGVSVWQTAQSLQKKNTQKSKSETEEHRRREWH